jgi:Domain of unknown function (DUF4333)
MSAAAPGEPAVPEETGRPRPPRRGYLLPGAIALVVLGILAAVINAAGLQHHRPRTLAGPDVATLIAENLQTRANAAQPPQVRCPPSEPVAAGVAFTCVLSTSHGPQDLLVHETNDQGAFTFSPPTP